MGTYIFDVRQHRKGKYTCYNSIILRVFTANHSSSNNTGTRCTCLEQIRCYKTMYELKMFVIIFYFTSTHIFCLLFAVIRWGDSIYSVFIFSSFIIKKWVCTGYTNHLIRNRIPEWVNHFWLTPIFAHPYDFAFCMGETKKVIFLLAETTKSQSWAVVHIRHQKPMFSLLCPISSYWKGQLEANSPFWSSNDMAVEFFMEVPSSDQSPLPIAYYIMKSPYFSSVSRIFIL